MNAYSRHADLPPHYSIYLAKRTPDAEPDGGEPDARLLRERSRGEAYGIQFTSLFNARRLIR